MSLENDLSDEAFWASDISDPKERAQMDKSPSSHALDGWQEAVRRAKANPWQLFDNPEDLDHILICWRDDCERCNALRKGIRSELERRKAK